MENTSLFKYYKKDEIQRTRNINLLGKNLDVKNYICSLDGENYRLKPENITLQLSILPTPYCNAHCPFCIAKDRGNTSKIDLKKLESTLVKLKDADAIRGVSITGGEPFSDVALLNDTINLVFDVLGNVELSLNTNGTGLYHLDKIDKLHKIDTIHVSRHHYDEKINQSIFGIPMPTNQEVKDIVNSISFKDIFVFNCMLLRDYINSKAEVVKYLEFLADLNVPKASFITCQIINDYCKEQMLDFEDVIDDSTPDFIFTRQYFDFDVCHCKDGIYASKSGKLVEFYGRTSCPDNCNYCRGFSFNCDNILREGFVGEKIL